MEKYTQIKCIGKGSFGKAFLCRNKETGTNVVIKEIDLSYMSQKEKDASMNEVRIIRALKSPYIIHYYESFIRSHVLHIVMEYGAGGDLETLVARRFKAYPKRPFKERVIQHWLFQLCTGLNQMHTKKILHRDIKSSNVFLGSDRVSAKIGDFGISKVLNSESGYAHTAIGTPYYLSPEICSESPYNEKSDIWALGCVVYELATYKHPFEAKSLPRLVAKIMVADYEPVSRGRYSEDFCMLVKVMLSVDPESRPTAAKVLEFLRAVNPAIETEKLTPQDIEGDDDEPEVGACPGDEDLFLDCSDSTSYVSTPTSTRTPTSDDADRKRQKLDSDLEKSFREMEQMEIKDMASFRKMVSTVKRLSQSSAAATAAAAARSPKGAPRLPSVAGVGAGAGTGVATGGNGEGKRKASMLLTCSEGSVENVKEDCSKQQLRDSGDLLGLLGYLKDIDTSLNKLEKTNF